MHYKNNSSSLQYGTSAVIKKFTCKSNALYMTNSSLATVCSLGTESEDVSIVIKPVSVPTADFAAFSRDFLGTNDKI